MWTRRLDAFKKGHGGLAKITAGRASKEATFYVASVFLSGQIAQAGRSPLSATGVQRQGSIAQGAQQIATVAEQQANGKTDLNNILSAGSAVEDFQQIAGSADALLGAGVKIGE